MEIQHQQHGNRGAFFIDEDGEWVAEMTYVRSGESAFIIDHTEVHDKFRGEGIGKDLVAEAVKFARANGLKIHATCPYARSVLERAEEYSDVFVS